IALTMGAASLRELFDEKYYEKLEGGILESFGRLFKNDLRLYIYPLLDEQTNALTTVETLEVAPRLRKLYGYLVDNGYIRQLENFNKSYLNIFSRDALLKIQAGDPTWESMVPAEVGEVIKRRRFLGYRPAEAVERHI
ncbi:MAG TPA: TonB-dependent receptor, partial [Polyangia bacterium]